MRLMSQKVCFCFLVMMTLVSACTSDDKTPAGEPLTPSFNLDATLLEFQNGKEVLVNLDSCDVSDEGWLSEGDPLGTLKCGEVYEVSYEAELGEWVTYGVNERDSARLGKEMLIRRGFKARGLASTEISLWGLTLNIGVDGSLTTREGDTVGHIGNSK